MKTTKFFGVISIISNFLFVAVAIYLFIESLMDYINFKTDEFMGISTGIALFLVVFGSVFIMAASIVVLIMCIIDYIALKKNKTTLHPIINLFTNIYILEMICIEYSDSVKHNNTALKYFCVLTILLVILTYIYDIRRLIYNKNIRKDKKNYLK